LLGIADRMNHKEGQQLRVAIARGIVNSPGILLADEPAGNLDSENSAAVLRLTKDLNHRLGQTIPTITHDSDVAAMLTGLSECAMGVSSKSAIVRRTGWPFSSQRASYPGSATEFRQTLYLP
jgi:ABC-type lipoprotein export system ATPase subunit